MARKVFNDPERRLDLAPPTEFEKHSLAGVLGERKRKLPKVLFAPLREIEPDPEQPRTVFEESRLEELAESIRQRGIEQPLIVLRLGDQRFRLIAGERRWRAAQRAGLEDAPVIAYDSLTDDEVDEYQLNEFVLGEQLTPTEKGRFIAAYKSRHELTWAQMAERFHIKERMLQIYVQLLEAAPALQEKVDRRELPIGTARLLTSLPEAVQEEIAEEAVRKHLPAKSVQELRDQYARDQESPVVDLGSSQEPVQAKQGSVMNYAPRSDGSTHAGLLGTDAEDGSSNPESVTNYAPRSPEPAPVPEPNPTLRRSRGQYSSELRTYVLPDTKRWLRHQATDYVEGGSESLLNRYALEWMHQDLGGLPDGLKDFIARRQRQETGPS